MSQKAEETDRDTRSPRLSGDTSEYESALSWLEKARDRFLSAAIAFCDGSISEGQLKAARELLREWEQRVTKLEGEQLAPFVEDEHVTSTPLPPEVIPAGPIGDETIEEVETAADAIPPALKKRLAVLDQKIARLEQDFQQGRINASQYRAVRRHYLQQRDVALRMSRLHPDSDRWQVVLEEGKTSFLMQLNEAACRAVGLYEKKSRNRIFVEGEMPESAEEAMALLGTFGTPEDDGASSRMFATQIDDGSALLLIPGRNTVCLGVFSQSPPAWQVRALREVHRNFEAVNHTSLNQAKTKNLIFPDLKRFVRG